MCIRDRPWTSTPATFLSLSCLYAAIAFSERPSAIRCFWCALSGALLLAFRPVDAVVVAIPALALVLLSSCRTLDRSAFWRTSCGGLIGGCLGLTAGVLA